MNKRFITAQELLEDSFRLAVQIVDSGFRLEFLLVRWRGGAPVGMAIHEYLHSRFSFIINELKLIDYGDTSLYRRNL